MQAYYIRYSVKGQEKEISVDAKDIQSAKRKIGHKHGYKDGRMIKINHVSIIGYF